MMFFFGKPGAEPSSNASNRGESWPSASPYSTSLALVPPSSCGSVYVIALGLSPIIFKNEPQSAI
jgi:hypothetical protein